MPNNRSLVRVSRHFDSGNRQKNQGVKAGGEAAFDLFPCVVSTTPDPLGLETRCRALLRLGTQRFDIGYGRGLVRIRTPFPTGELCRQGRHVRKALEDDIFNTITRDYRLSGMVEHFM